MRAIGPCLTSLFALTACFGGGGGAGGGSGSPASFAGLDLPITGNPAAFVTSEYLRSEALAPIDASLLYAAGGTGAGVTVGLIDTGIDAGNPEFAGALHPASTDLLRAGPLADGSGHGTAVAGLLGARRDGAGIHGMAFDADLLVVRADTPGTCPHACLFNQNNLATATDHAVANGARVLNFSLGEASSLAGGFRQSLSAAAEAGRVLVLAAGNGGGASPQQPALFATSGAARGAGIIVGAVDDTGTISAFSNRAGKAADVFIVAPGEALRSTAAGGGTVQVSGTSTATPLVAGAAAALISAAPHLSAANVVTILLDSARDLGDPGTDPIYGRGMLDLARALSPMGSLRVPEGVSTHAVSRPLASTKLSLGDAFGVTAPKVGPVMALDAFDRAYTVTLPSETARHGTSALPDFVRRQHGETTERLAEGGLALDLVRSSLDAPGSGLAESDYAGLSATWRLDESLTLRTTLGATAPSAGADRLGFWQQRQAGGQTASHVDLAAPASLELDAALDDVWRVSFTVAGDPDGTFETMAGGQRGWSGEPGRFDEPRRGHLAALGLTRAPENAIGWRLGLGLLGEADGPLGSTGSGALATSGAITRFVDLAATVPFTDRIQGFGRAALGRTETSGKNGLIDDMEALWSTSFAVGVTVDELAREDDRLTFGLSQPLRVEAGKTTLDVPISRDLAGNVARAERRLDMAPAGREVALELGYGLPLGGDAEKPGRLQSAVMLRFAPDHDASAPPELLFGVSYRLVF